MKRHRAIQPALSALAILFSLAIGIISSSAAVAGAEPQTPQDFLRQMAALAPDNCSAVPAPPPTVDADHSEELLFESVEALLADRLNRPTLAHPSEAEARAKSALREVEQSSAEINKSWPEENRFHFEVLALHPAILVRMSYRDAEKVVLFGSFHRDEYAVDAGTKWHEVGFEDPSSRASGIDLFLLHRGPSGRGRLLARAWYSGCAGSIGEAYYGYEWSPEAGDFPEQIIKIEGAESLDSADSKSVGKLSTTGTRIQLPYCFFSTIDTWDNPTLCAADSFDLSGDAPRFTGRTYNSPDLVVLNKAIQYAQAHDYIALRGYCASDAVAKRLIRGIPPFLFPDELRKIKLGPQGEKVVLQDPSVSFNLVERRGQWLLENFRIDRAE